MKTIRAHTDATDFQFTSIIVNKDFASKAHVDRGNAGDSYIIALGNFEGGGLWVESNNSSEALELYHKVSGKYREGSIHYGEVHEVRDRWFRYDGRTLHYTKPYSGERVSLVYYTNSQWYSDRVPSEAREQLVGLGFPTPAVDRSLTAGEPAT